MNKRIGVELQNSSIKFRYNVPLSFHSSIYEIQCDKERGTLVLKIEFYGEDTPQDKRWPKLEKAVKQLHKLEILALREPLTCSATHLAWEWELKDVNSLKVALEEYSIMLDFIYSQKYAKTDFKGVVDGVVNRSVERGDRKAFSYYLSHLSTKQIDLYKLIIKKGKSEQLKKILEENLLGSLNQRKKAISICKLFITKDAFFVENVIKKYLAEEPEIVLELFKEFKEVHPGKKIEIEKEVVELIAKKDFKFALNTLSYFLIYDSSYLLYVIDLLNEISFETDIKTKLSALELIGAIVRINSDLTPENKGKLKKILERLLMSIPTNGDKVNKQLKEAAEMLVDQMDEEGLEY